MAKYAYDPFGQVLSVTNASGTAISATAANVANYNPFRYRGYYYDTESGFYYLQSRYYDPEICRFINADNYASTGQGFLGCNMFAYCNNNPVQFTDTTGDFFLVDDLVLAAGLLIFAVVVVVVYTPPVQEAIRNLADAITDVFVNTIENIEDIVSKTKEASKKKKEKKQTRKSGKEASKDKPSWVNEKMIDKNLTAQQNATKLLNEKYGPGNWKKGAGEEFNQIVKWINRSGILLRIVSYLWETPEER